MDIFDLATQASPKPEKRAHAFVSASASKRWMKCTASPGFVARNRDKLPISDESDYSAEGTLAHDLASTCLMLGYDAGLFEDKEMARHVKGYVELINRWREEDDVEFFVEKSVPLFYYIDEEGFLDAAAVKLDGSVVRIGDLKYGAGVSVQAKENTQLAIYAMSLIEELSILFPFTDKTLVQMTIYQPRIHDEPAVRMWCVSLAELRAFCAPIGWIAQAIYADPDGGEFSPDDETCRFCDGVSLCGARAANIFGELPAGTVAVVHEDKPKAFPLPQTLNPDQLARVVAAADGMRHWLQECENFAFHRLQAGLEFKGYKVVAGRSTRKWRNEDEAAELLLLTDLPAEEQFTVKVLSPAQAEEKLSREDWAKIKHAVIKPEGKPTMVLETDKRPALVIKGTDYFSDLTDGTDLLK